MLNWSLFLARPSEKERLDVSLGHSPNKHSCQLQSVGLNHIWSISTEGKTQCGGQAQWPWSLSFQLKSNNASQHLSLPLMVTKRSILTFTLYLVGFFFFCHTDVLLGSGEHIKLLSRVSSLRPSKATISIIL